MEHYSKRGKSVSEYMQTIRKEYTDVDKASSVTQLMGIEGKVRETYYHSFNTFLRRGFEFNSRTRLPPQDAINCLISFGNSLLYSTVLTEIYHTQLTPTVSYLHEPGERRYSLALDVSEIFKPVIVDRVIFNLVNNRVINDKHFNKKLNFCYLNEDGKKTFLSHYKEKLDGTRYHSSLKRNVSYQHMIRLECFKIIKHLVEDKTYVGFKFR